MNNSIAKKRKQFADILNKYGHTILLQRRCTVSDPVGPYHKHPEDCSGCSGKGFLQVHERHCI